MGPRGRKGAAAIAARGGELAVAFVVLGVGQANAATVSVEQIGAKAPTCGGEPATIVAERPVVRGTPGDDVIVVRRGGALIEAGGGSDLVCTVTPGFHEVYGGPGDDRIHGSHSDENVYPGTGDDFVSARGGEDLISDFEDRGDDVYRGGSGEDQIRFSALFYRLQVDAVRVDLGGGWASGHGHDRVEGFEALEGTGKRDTLIGDANDNSIYGIRGGDRLAGGGGDDLVVGATVHITEEGRNDPYDGDDASLRGGPGADRIYGLQGADRLSGGPGDDLLDGGAPARDGSGPADRGNGGGGSDECRELERATFCER